MKFVMQIRENMKGLLKRGIDGVISLWKKSIKFFNMKRYVWLANLILLIFILYLHNASDNMFKPYHLFIFFAMSCILTIVFKSRLKEMKCYKDYILKGEFVARILPLDVLIIFLSLCWLFSINGILYDYIDESHKNIAYQVYLCVYLVVIYTRLFQYMLIDVVYGATKTIISMGSAFLTLFLLICFWVILPDNIIGEAIIFVGSYKLFEWYFSEDRIYALYYASRKKWKKAKIPRYIKLKWAFLKSFGTLSLVSLIVSNATIKKVFQVLSPREFSEEVNVIQRLVKGDAGEAFPLYIFYSTAVFIVYLVLILIFIYKFKIYFKSEVGDNVIYPSRSNRKINIGAIDKEFKRDKKLPDSEMEVVMANAEEIQEATRDFVLKQLSRHLKGYALEGLVADLLNAMGYRTTVSAQGGDSGIDITAYKDELPPRILVQVKSQDSPIKEATIQSLKGAMKEGDYGLFVTLSSYTKNAQKYLDNTPIIRGINGTELVDLLVKHYPNLSPRYQQLIPLKRVYIPMPQEA